MLCGGKCCGVGSAVGWEVLWGGKCCGLGSLGLRRVAWAPVASLVWRMRAHAVTRRLRGGAGGWAFAAAVGWEGGGRPHGFVFGWGNMGVGAWVCGHGCEGMCVCAWVCGLGCVGWVVMALAWGRGVWPMA